VTTDVAKRLLSHRLAQPDNRSCGAASMVVARALTDEGYAHLLLDGVHPVSGWQQPGSVLDRFRSEVLAMHARITGPVTASGRLQLPWPRAFGTPPWAAAHQLSNGGREYVVVPALLRREHAFGLVRAGAVTGGPSAVYVGSRWTPRHVVLAIRPDEADGVWCYDPAPGMVRRITAAAFEAGRLDLSGWDVPWCVVVPRV
jgi:hypothetical protein